MKCGSCGADLENVPGPLLLSDPVIGPFVAPVREYLQCPKCREILIPGDAAATVDAARKKRLDELLLALPLAMYVTASQAAAMLGVSRQALHKNRKIRNGFVFHIRFGENMLYLRQSVELFRNRGDGRFQLFQPTNIASHEAPYDAPRASYVGENPYSGKDQYYRNVERWFQKDLAASNIGQEDTYVES